MENVKQKMSDLVNRTRPLPRPEVEANKFLGSFPNLNQKEIQGIVKIVIDEVRKSREFGLFLGPELIEREELLFLTFFNTFGGIKQTTEKMEFDQAIKMLNELEDEFFEEELKSFFEKFKKEKGGTPGRYGIHFHSLNGILLNLAYSHQIEE